MTRLPRALHPVAWWVWAIGLAAAASRTTNPLLLVLVLAVLAFVGQQPAQRRAVGAGVPVLLPVRAGRGRRSGSCSAPCSPPGSRRSDHILFTLPTVHTPGWYAGIQIGGPVSLEATLSAAVDGLRLGTLLCCVGAANALANPKRALRVLPSALYELGVAVVVAISIAPQLIESGQRVRRARRLRADRASGLRPLRSHRHPGRRGRPRPVAARSPPRWTRAGTAAAGPRPRASRRRHRRCCCWPGCSGCASASYGLLDPTLPRLLGRAHAAARGRAVRRGLALGGRRVRTTSYRPDPWRLPEWVVALLGVGAAARRRGQPHVRPRPAEPAASTRCRGRSCPVVPAVGDPARRPGRRRRAAAAAHRRAAARRTDAPRSTGSTTRPGRSPRPRGRADDRLRPRHRHLRRRPPRRCCATSA